MNKHTKNFLSGHLLLIYNKINPKYVDTNILIRYKGRKWKENFQNGRNIKKKEKTRDFISSVLYYVNEEFRNYDPGLNNNTSKFGGQ